METFARVLSIFMAKWTGFDSLDDLRVFGIKSAEVVEGFYARPAFDASPSSKILISPAASWSTKYSFSGVIYSHSHLLSPGQFSIG